MATRTDRPLQNVLNWAMERMRTCGYGIESRVTIASDPELTIMGYAKQVGGVHHVVVADWALDSEMLGGLVLHELAHIYATDNGAPTHNRKIIDEVILRLKEREGLNDREVGYLVDAFDHLQNITVDDMVFEAMDRRLAEQAGEFFMGWVSEQPSGSPTLDAALLARNAFAIASLKRHKMYRGGEIGRRNSAFISSLGDHAVESFDWMEGFLETARGDWAEKEFRERLEEYLDRVVSLMTEPPAFKDLR